MSADVFVVAAKRTPIASRSRALSRLTVSELAAPLVRALAAETSASIADVVLGNCMGPGGNPARVAALAGGLSVSVPGATLDRQCGSGLAAIIDAANAIRAGDSRPRIAGGAESASTAPERSIDGAPYSRASFAPPGFADPDMLDAADALATRLTISRERQDAYAVRSIERARSAVAEGRFDDEILSIDNVSVDELPSLATELAMPRFRPILDHGSVTGGNSCRVSDGASAVLLAAAPVAGRRALRLRSHAVVGCDPALPGLGAAFAIRAALETADAQLDDIIAFEIVEAFAAQQLAVLQSLGIADDDARVCADGGAIALGHPWGASAATSVVRLFGRLALGGVAAGSLGVAAASVGGGMGIAAVFEVVE